MNILEIMVDRVQKNNTTENRKNAICELIKSSSSDLHMIESDIIRLGAVLFEKPDFKLSDIKAGTVKPMSVIDHHYILCLRGLGLIII